MLDRMQPVPAVSTVRDLQKIALSHGRTPLEDAPGLGAALGGPRILMKRDDCTGFALGGNKCRKLEYIFADALTAGCDIVLTAAGRQSNHCRQTAAAAARCGLDVRLLLAEMVDRTDPAYQGNGNLLLDKIYGARIEIVGRECDTAGRLQDIAESLRREGRSPYIIDFGGSTPRGAQGYIDCAAEIVQQAKAIGANIDHIVLASGSGGTQAGLIAGFREFSPETRVHGISILREDEAFAGEVLALARDASKLAGFASIPGQEDCLVHFEHLGSGYGLPTVEMQEAILLAARTEALLFDPVYTGKAMAGLRALIEKRVIRDEETVVFLHTGGAPGIFAYQELFETCSKGETA